VRSGKTRSDAEWLQERLEVLSPDLASDLSPAAEQRKENGRGLQAGADVRSSASVTARSCPRIRNSSIVATRPAEPRHVHVPRLMCMAALETKIWMHEGDETPGL